MREYHNRPSFVARVGLKEGGVFSNGYRNVMKKSREISATRVSKCSSIKIGCEQDSRNKLSQCRTRAQESRICRNIVPLRSGNPIHRLSLRIRLAWIKDSVLYRRNVIPRRGSCTRRIEFRHWYLYIYCPNLMWSRIVCEARDRAKP
jgi:hypothetical protein